MGKGKKITEEEKLFILKNWEGMSNKDIGVAIGVCEKTISRVGRNLGLVDKRAVLSGDYKRTRVSNKIAECGPGPETILEIKAREKTLELEHIRHELGDKDFLRLSVKTEAPNLPDKILGGKIIQKNRNFIAIKLANYIECFKYEDFFTGKAVVI